jgi:transcriptional regulator with XRE-family HTH domain
MQRLFESYLHGFWVLVGPGRVRYGLLCTPKICFFPIRGAFPNRSGKLSKVTEMNPFGVPFGRLVRDKRGIEGLSQDGLAEKSGLTKARISDIENGKIANPQARTVDALCVALNISQDERAACHPNAESRLPPRLLEKLARHFGHDNPDALEGELEAFLKAKAAEFREMRKRLEKMAETEGRSRNFSRPPTPHLEKATSTLQTTS